MQSIKENPLKFYSLESEAKPADFLKCKFGNQEKMLIENMTESFEQLENKLNYENEFTITIVIDSILYIMTSI